MFYIRAALFNFILFLVFANGSDIKVDSTIEHQFKTIEKADTRIIEGLLKGTPIYPQELKEAIQNLKLLREQILAVKPSNHLMQLNKAFEKQKQKIFDLTNHNVPFDNVPKYEQLPKKISAEGFKGILVGCGNNYNESKYPNIYGRSKNDNRHEDYITISEEEEKEWGLESDFHIDFKDTKIVNVIAFISALTGKPINEIYFENFDGATSPPECLIIKNAYDILSPGGKIILWGNINSRVGNPPRLPALECLMKIGFKNFERVSISDPHARQKYRQINAFTAIKP